MEDIVAVEIELEDGRKRYFMTWGRIQHVVNPVKLEKIVLKFSSSCALNGKPLKATICDSLQEASQARYFYESLFDISQRKFEYGTDYEQWRKEMDKLMHKGKEIWYLGLPKEEQLNMSHGGGITHGANNF